jgi:hypothetical protein
MLRAGNHAKHFRRALVQGAARGNPKTPASGNCPQAGASEAGSRLSDADIIRRSSGPRAACATQTLHTYAGAARARPSEPGLAQTSGARACGAIAVRSGVRRPKLPLIAMRRRGKCQWNSMLKAYSCAIHVFFHTFLNVKCSKVGQTSQSFAGLRSPNQSTNPAAAPVCLRNTHVLC